VFKIPFFKIHLELKPQQPIVHLIPLYSVDRNVPCVLHKCKESL